jgi:signal transduction histidine kinase
MTHGERRLRPESLERTMLALRDAREVHDVLSLAARSLSRLYKRPCIAYDVRAGELRPIETSDPSLDRAPIPADRYDAVALRARVVVQRGDDHFIGIVADNELRAVLVLEYAALDDEDLKHVRALAAHASLAFANALAFDQLRRYAAEGAALTDAARTILGYTEIEPLAAALCRLANRFVLAERACIYVKRGEVLERLAYTSLGPEAEPPPERVVLDGSEMTRALTATFGNRSIFARLRLPGGEEGDDVRGCLVVLRNVPFERSELRLIETLVTLAALAIRNVDLYEQSTRANRALAESNAFKDDLMAMFAHDFKGPLTVISGFAELLFDSKDPSVERSARTIVEQTRRLAKLSDDALALAATQSAGFSLSHEREDVTEFVRVTAAPLDREGNRLSVTAPDRPIMLSFDRSRLRHVIDNVVGNALKYSNGPVTVAVEAREREVRVAVRDSGIGIPAQSLERIFLRFGRATNARSKGISGSGVGLYIAKKIVEVHGGRLEVHSTENEGSTFTIVLPL